MFYYLSLAAALFAIGLYGAFARKNFAGKLVALFIMLNAIIINLAAFNKFVQTDSATGLVFILFVLLIALTEFLLGALMLNQWHSTGSQNNPNDSVDMLQ